MLSKADIIIINANELITAKGDAPKKKEHLADCCIIKKGALAITGDRIIDVGHTENITELYKSAKIIDASNKIVMPGFVDSHTHLVFSGSRHQEYQEKVTGKIDYERAHQEGMGIFYTVKMTRNASEDELIGRGLKDLGIMLRHGTTSVEIKSGYGLDRENELKILRVIQKLKNLQPVDIIATFLGAHTIPKEYNKDVKADRRAYINLVKELIPVIVRNNLAEFCDAWCDSLAFSLDETREILMFAKSHGMKLKIHAEQTSYSGGAELAVELDAKSADHLDYLTDNAIKKIANSNVIGVLLPGVTYHLMEMIPGVEGKPVKDFMPVTVRKMINAGVAIALATDYNPGSCRTQSMKTVMECAARLYRMSYAEIINAVTFNAACAIDRAGSIGSLEKGKKADIVIHNCESHGELIDNFGINMVATVIKNGKIVHNIL